MIKNATCFSVMDLSSAYHQVLLHPDSRHLTSFVTPLGAFRFIRMPFGLASAAACFQRVMNKVLEGLSKVLIFQDDILVYGIDRAEHDRHLWSVLQRLQDAGLVIKKEKCKLCVSSVNYLGHTISGDGISPKLDIVESIVKASKPTSKDQVRSFLGLAEFCAKFVPNFASVSSPLRSLLKKGIQFAWSAECMSAFNSIKEVIGRMPTLGHFDACKKTVIY